MPECPICFVDINHDCEYKTKCNHVFCKCCIERLFKDNDEMPCPICRYHILMHDYKFDEYNNFENMSVEEIFAYYYIAATSQESQCLTITPDLLNVIKFITTTDDKKYLNYFLSDKSYEHEFKLVYNEFFIKKKKIFIKLDFFNDITLSLLYYKYH